MKTKYLTIVLALGLVAALGGAILLSARGETLLAAIRFDPRDIDMDGPAAVWWLATIRVDKAGPSWDTRDINPETILFEGTVPSVDGYFIPGGYVARFNGLAVHNAILGAIYHMQLPPDYDKKIQPYFTVTGNLNDGTPFLGEGKIKVYFPYGVPPAPLPAP